MKTNQLDLSLEDTPQEKDERINSIRSKVFHNEPLTDTEIGEVEKAVKGHSELTEEQISSMIGKLGSQNKKPLLYALTLKQRGIVDIALASLQSEIRNQVVATIEE